VNKKEHVPVLLGPVLEGLNIQPAGAGFALKFSMRHHWIMVAVLMFEGMCVVVVVVVVMLVWWWIEEC
jgi:hypothetical protein